MTIEQQCSYDDAELYMGQLGALDTSTVTLPLAEHCLQYDATVPSNESLLDL